MTSGLEFGDQGTFGGFEDTNQTLSFWDASRRWALRYFFCKFFVYGEAAFS